jgi:hypothetical protein
MKRSKRESCFCVFYSADCMFIVTELEVGRFCFALRTAGLPLPLQWRNTSAAGDNDVRPALLEDIAGITTIVSQHEFAKSHRVSFQEAPCGRD